MAGDASNTAPPLQAQVQTAAAVRAAQAWAQARDGVSSHHVAVAEFGDGSSDEETGTVPGPLPPTEPGRADNVEAVAASQAPAEVEPKAAAGRLLKMGFARTMRSLAPSGLLEAKVQINQVTLRRQAYAANRSRTRRLLTRDLNARTGKHAGGFPSVLLPPDSSLTACALQPGGNLVTASTKLFTVTVGISALALPLSLSWLGWIAGPPAIVFSFLIATYTASLLASVHEVGGVRFKRYYDLGTAVLVGLGARAQAAHRRGAAAEALTSLPPYLPGPAHGAGDRHRAERAAFQLGPAVPGRGGARGAVSCGRAEAWGPASSSLSCQPAPPPPLCRRMINSLKCGADWDPDVDDGGCGVGVWPPMVGFGAAAFVVAGLNTLRTAKTVGTIGIGFAMCWLFGTLGMVIAKGEGWA
jgi:hypothetical protein